MTIRENISTIRGTHRLLSSDASINDRTIARELRDTALLLVTREVNRRKLFSSPNLFTLLPCLQMEEVPLAECCEYTSPLTIARSKEPLPKIAEGIYGSLIQAVSTVDNRVYFKESSPKRYANILKLQLPNKEIYFWIYNNYLYVTSPELKAVNISCYPEEDVPTNLLYPGEDCECKDKPKIEDLCKNPLDQPFRCPGYLVSAVNDIVSKKLLTTYFRLPEDATGNNADDQVPNK